MKWFKSHNTVPFLATITLSLLYCIFAFGFSKYTSLQAQSRLSEHSLVIADDLWNYNASGAVAYIKLAATADHYEKLEVTNQSGEIFQQAVTNFPTPFEKILLRLHLISKNVLSNPITFDGKKIGQIEATWIPQTYITLTFTFCLLLMMNLIIFLYDKIIKEKHLLSKRVAERTNELTELNESLRNEIRERAQAEKEREELQQKLAHSKKMESLGLLAGGVAHDLNNVLSGIVSYPDLLLMDMEMDNPIRSSIETIRKSGIKAGEIVQDLLTLARRGVVTKQPLNFNTLIREYCGSPEYEKLVVQHSAEIEMVLQLEEPLPAVMGSPIALTKIIMNLISNGIEAQPEGGRILIETKRKFIQHKVTCFQPIKKGEYIIFSVVDEGEGISNEDLQRIFEPFYTRKVMGRSGTGLGLTIVWGTVEDHDGGIDVVSNAGEGTTIDIYLPASSEMATDPLGKLPPKQLLGNGETILVVDDIDFQRQIACAILERLQYKVHSVASGEEAAQYLTEKSVDLVILDMIMDGGMDGLETYKQITAIRPEQKAIIASGFSETDRVREAQKLGAGNYIKKPYKIDQLSLAVMLELQKKSTAQSDKN